MSRCERCNACQSMWDTGNCKFCNFPAEEARPPEQIKEDEEDFAEYCKNNYR